MQQIPRKMYALLFASFLLTHAASALECGITLAPTPTKNATNDQFKQITDTCVASLNKSGITYGLSPPSKESEEGKDQFLETENCVVQCIFLKLGMTDSNGYPDHAKILEGLLKSATGRELRDFLQESTDECFQVMERVDAPDPCLYSNLLVTCLADKGRTNCADWPAGNLPFH